MTEMQQVLDRLDELKTDFNKGFSELRNDQKDLATSIVELRVETTRMAVTQENMDAQLKGGAKQFDSMRARLNRIERLFLPVAAGVGTALHWISQQIHWGR